MKVFFDSGTDKGHDVRGIGVHTEQLIKALGSKVEIVKKRESADIIHFTYFKPFEKTLVPFFKKSGVKYVLTIHDLIALIYPKHYPSGIKGKFISFLNKIIVKKNVDAVITISETSKKDICRFLKINPRKVFVTYLAAKRDYKERKIKDELNLVKKKYDLPDKFVFNLGDVNYNKNIPALVKVCKKLNTPLIIAGKHVSEIESMDFKHPELSHLKNVDFSDVLRPGYISDSDACCLYKLATVFVQPSFYEGFGFSVVHAFAAGCPVVCAKTQALVETAGDAAMYFDPKNKDDLEKTIKKVLENKNLRDNLVRKGSERVKDFSWTKTASDTYSVYEKVLRNDSHEK